MTRDELAQSTVMVLSVPHTGTRFAKRVLQQRCKVRPIHVTDSEEVIEQRLSECAFVVMPIRNPEDCWRGWYKRGRGDAEKFVAAWRAYQVWADRTDPMILPIDTPSRKDYLGQIEQALGTTLPTDWQPVGGQPHVFVDEPCPDVWSLPVVSRFYGLKEVGVPL